MMSTRESNHTREELRALLVLGIIGTLLGARDVLNANLGYGLTINSVAKYLILWWGIYIFLMAIGISDDWVYPPICKACVRAAEIAFCTGISVTCAMALYTVVALVLATFMNQTTSAIIAAIPALLFGIFMVRQIRRKPKLLQVTSTEASNTNQQK